MSIKVLFVRMFTEIYLSMRSFGYGLFAISWLFIKRIIAFFNRHGLGYKPVYRNRRRRQGTYYRVRSRRYDLQTARLIRHVDRWLG